MPDIAFDPASAVLMVDLLNEILQNAVIPRQAELALTRQVRDITGSRLVLLLKEDEQGHPVRIATAPPQQESILDSPDGGRFFEMVSGIEAITIWDNTTPDSLVSLLLAANRMQNALVVPLVTGEARVGTLVILDFTYTGNIRSLTWLMEMMSRVLALVLQNASIHEETVFYSRQLENEIEWRKQAEQVLLERTEELDNYFNTSLDLFCIADTNGYFRRLNPEWEQSLGYPVSELEGRRFLDFVHPDDLQPTLDAIRDLENQKTVINFTNRYRHRDGTYRWIEWRSIPKGECIFAAARDITDRKRMEEEMRESEELYRSILRASPDDITITDLEGTILMVSPATLTFFGYSREEDLIGHPITEFIVPDDHERAMVHITQMMRGIFTGPGEFRAIHADGSTFYIESNADFIRDDAGRPSRMIFVVRDITERKRMEEALRQSEEKFRALVETTSDFIWEVDTSGLYTYVSPQVTQMLGYRPDEMIGKNQFDFMEMDEAERIRAVSERFGGPPHPLVSLEDRCIHRDGSLVIMETNSVPFYTKDGNLAGYRGIVRDITRRKQYETDLRESKARLRSILNGTPVMQFVIDCNHRVISWNLAMEEYSGIRAADIIGTDGHWKALYHKKRPTLPDLLIDDDEESITRWYPGTEKVRKSGFIEGAYQITTFFPGMGASGAWLVGTAAPIRDTGGAIIAAIETLEDITEQRRAEDALRESEEKYRGIIEGMQDIFYRTDLAGKITMISPSAVKIGGFESVDQLIGQDAAAMYTDPAERELLLSVLREKGTVEAFPLTLRRRDGTLRRAVVSSHFFHDAKGTVQGVEGVIHDLTDLIQAQEGFQAANKKLNLLSSITRHDINNQLTVMKGYLAILKDSQKDSPTEIFLQKVSDAADRITSMIQFTKNYENIGVEAPAWQDLRALVATAAMDLKPETIRIINNPAPGTEIFADPLVGKVFYNLLDNAIRYGGTITQVSFSTRRKGEHLVIICEDDGVGVPPGEKEKIFARGFGKNTGLGLFLSREILAITNITITENGTPGVGARFEITVPVGAFRFSGSGMPR